MDHMAKTTKQTILIVDDSPLNRSMLADMLGDEYSIIEAEDGIEAIAILNEKAQSLSLVLLDLVMPGMDGFGVLEMMRKQRWIDDLPVIIISSENTTVHSHRAYEMGATEFIGRPFDMLVLRQRVKNTMLLYMKQKRLIDLVADQIYEKEQQNKLMVDILGHITEFKNGETGAHAIRIQTLTELILIKLSKHKKEYGITRSDISRISTASALHDIGKIFIRDDILGKPAKLGKGEYTAMQAHAMAGAEMIQSLQGYKDNPFIQTAYEICRWHHERWDGNGYPDGLAGDDIPIAAQVVALADVYDALTSERSYKKAFSHEKAMQMIKNGECGQFNPVLMDCLDGIDKDIEKEKNILPSWKSSHREVQNIAEEMLKHRDLSASERTLQLLENERLKYAFFADMSDEIQFEYDAGTGILKMTAYSARKLGLSEITMNPKSDEKILKIMESEYIKELSGELRTTSPEHPRVKYDHKMRISGEERWVQTTACALWSNEEPPRYMGAIGKTIDVHDERSKIEALTHMATRDPMTGLYNKRFAQEKITARLKDGKNSKFALLIFDMDHFKSANDTYGHQFGDEVIMHAAEQIKACVRAGDIAARVGGDEFIIFLEYKENEAEIAVERIHAAICGQYKEFKISVSMGVALTENVEPDYEKLFSAADQALYVVKRTGRGRFNFYCNIIGEMMEKDHDGKTEEAG